MEDTIYIVNCGCGDKTINGFESLRKFYCEHTFNLIKEDVECMTNDAMYSLRDTQEDFLTHCRDYVKLCEQDDYVLRYAHDIGDSVSTYVKVR